MAVHTADGSTVRVRRAVIADVAAPALYAHLLPRDALPARLFADLEHFIWDTPVVKVNYALDAPIPWHSTNLRRAGTVHLGADAHGLMRWMADLNTATVPHNPFLLLGQMSTADPSRSPEGTESAWAYTHLPRDRNDDESADKLSRAVDRVIEEHPPALSATSSAGWCSGPPICSQPMPTCPAEQSTVAPLSCSSSSSFGRPPGLGPRGRRSAMYFSGVRLRTPAAVCTGSADATPRRRH